MKPITYNAVYQSDGVESCIGSFPFRYMADAALDKHARTNGHYGDTWHVTVTPDALIDIDLWVYYDNRSPRATFQHYCHSRRFDHVTPSSLARLERTLNAVEYDCGKRSTWYGSTLLHGMCFHRESFRKA